MGKDALSNLVQRGLVIIDQKGYVPMLYTYTNYTTHLNMATLSVYDLWIADYRGYNGYGPAEIWQYTSSGSVDGISGNVDLNYCYKDFYTPPTVDEDPDDNEEEENAACSENPPEETPKNRKTNQMKTFRLVFSLICRFLLLGQCLLVTPLQLRRLLRIWALRIFLLIPTTNKPYRSVLLVWFPLVML